MFPYSTADKSTFAEVFCNLALVNLPLGVMMNCVIGQDFTDPGRYGVQYERFGSCGRVFQGAFDMLLAVDVQGGKRPRCGLEEVREQWCRWLTHHCVPDWREIRGDEPLVIEWLGLFNIAIGLSDQWSVQSVEFRIDAFFRTVPMDTGDSESGGWYLRQGGDAMNVLDDPADDYRRLNEAGGGLVEREYWGTRYSL